MSGFKGKRSYLGGTPPNTPPYSKWTQYTGLAFYQPMAAYLVARHRQLSVLRFGLYPDTDKRETLKGLIGY